jgi:hypothetical protein
MEFPISFFLDYAWNPTKIGAADLQRYTQQWAASQFGNKYATDIADIISKYTKYNGRRKPELLDWSTYSITNYGEAAMVVKEYNDLLKKAEAINRDLPAEYKDAYFQLVLHPVKACANLQELYYTIAMNRTYADEKSLFANDLAKRAQQLYLKDSLITLEYHSIAKGKWNHMMDQAHIGYTNWQQPPRQKMPEIKFVSANSAISDKPVFDSFDTTAENLVPAGSKGNIFYEFRGCLSIEADHFTKAANTNTITWKILPDHGRTGSAITTFPVTAATQKPGGTAPQLQYDIYVYDTGKVNLYAYFSPTLNFHNDEGLQYAISIDNETPQIISTNKDDNNPQSWNRWVANNIIIKTTTHNITKKGKHTIKYWMVSPCVILQKLVMDFGGMKPSYLGPPETRKK